MARRIRDLNQSHCPQVFSVRLDAGATTEQRQKMNYIEQFFPVP